MHKSRPVLFSSDSLKKAKVQVPDWKIGKYIVSLSFNGEKAGNLKDRNTPVSFKRETNNIKRCSK